jgi:hypothetical protein
MVKMSEQQNEEIGGPSKLKQQSETHQSRSTSSIIIMLKT